MRVIITFIGLLFLAACGGGGGGSTASSGASAAYNFTVSNTYFGPSVYIRDYGTYSTSGARGECQPSAEGCVIGAEGQVNADTDAITFYSDWGINESNFSSGWTFAASDTASVETVSSSNNLTSTNYNYESTDSANGYTRKLTVAIPSSFSHQVWTYWDNTHALHSYNNYAFGVLGTENTQYTNLPTSGSATYTGGAEMVHITPDHVSTGISAATFAVDWSTKRISGGFASVSMTGTGGAITFPAMTMAATDIDQGSYTVSGNAIAIFDGNLTYTGMGAAGDNYIYSSFYGPLYNEIGGTFSLTTSGSRDVGGYFAAKR